MFKRSLTSLSSLFSAFIIFGIGFLTRPIGGLLFGLWGDRIGRKSAFIGSIIVMTVPTIAMGFLSPYAKWGIYAPLSLIILRLIQSLPESGESPGTFCFLYENANKKNKRFITSWGAFGNQIGAILGVFEVLILDQFMSEAFLLSWGWKISFWSGGIIGLLGIFLRSRLDETPVFKELKEHHKIDNETIGEVIINHKKNIGLGTAFGALNAATFYMIATYLPTYFNKTLGFSAHSNAFISLSILVLTTILLPIFGVLGDKFRNRPIMIACALSIIILLFPLYYSINNKKLILTMAITYVYILPITCITALIPYLLAHLFSASVRYTGVGLAFNLADGIIGGFTPAIAIALVTYTNNQASFCWFILACAIVSLISYFKIKE